MLVALSLTAILAACRDLLEDCGMIPAAIGGIFLVGSAAWCFSGETFIFTELWGGLLMLFSVCAYRRGFTRVGFGTGLFALFYRELVLPYTLVCLGLAVVRGRSARRSRGSWG